MPCTQTRETFETSGIHGPYTPFLASLSHITTPTWGSEPLIHMIFRIRVGVHVAFAALLFGENNSHRDMHRVIYMLELIIIMRYILVRGSSPSEVISRSPIRADHHCTYSSLTFHVLQQRIMWACVIQGFFLLYPHTVYLEAASVACFMRGTKHSPMLA